MILLVGASASGKTEVGKILSRKYNITKVVTYTTRSKRINEINGIDYFFIDKDRFLELYNKDFFFETVCYNENYYGTSKESLIPKSYLIVEPEGLKKYASLKDNITFYLKCSEQERIRRMQIRGDNSISAKKRIAIDSQVFNNEELKNIAIMINTEEKSVEEIADFIASRYLGN